MYNIKNVYMQYITILKINVIITWLLWYSKLIVDSRSGDIE